MLVSTNAIVLKTIPFKESSLISKIFTENNGKVSIIAKGAWRPKKTIGSILEPMKHIHIQYYYKNNRNIQICKEAELINEFSKIRSNLDKIILGQIIVESIDKSTLENNSMPIIYKLAFRILEKINEPHLNSWKTFAFYLYQISLRMGFKPNVITCNTCNNKLKQAIINYQTGKLICLSCSINNKKTLSSKALNFLQNLEKIHLNNLHTETIDSNEIINVINFLIIFNYIHVEGMNKVKSIDLLKKLHFNNYSFN